MPSTPGADNADAVLRFWFQQHGPKQWWKKDAAFDQSCRERFLALYHSAARGELADWRERPDGRLAEIIVLDQFSRNMFRDTAQAFAGDAIALVLAQEAVRAGADLVLPPVQRKFLYMPFMHSESRLIHERALPLFEALDRDEHEGENTLEFERRHKAIIDRFGRYPHRNALLGRESTPEEREFLTQPGSSF